jgi:hypothetical protein
MRRRSHITLAALAVAIAVGGANLAAPVSAALPACTVEGTDGDDVFQAPDHPADAVICGGEGDDTVTGALRGTFVGGPGKDRVLTNKGTVYGQAGRDHVRRNHATGRFLGGAGSDSVGGAGYGNEGTFRGGDGPDAILTFNSSVFRGGPGSDRVKSNSLGTFHGGSGVDRVEWNIGVFYGGPGADSVKNNAVADVDPGGPFRGRFHGQAGDDHVEWNAGLFWGGLGFDTVGENVGAFKPGPQ